MVDSGLRFVSRQAFVKNVNLQYMWVRIVSAFYAKTAQLVLIYLTVNLFLSFTISVTKNVLTGQI